MARSDVTVRVKFDFAELVLALKVARDALVEISENYPELDGDPEDADTMVGRYDHGRDVAEEALAEIQSIYAKAIISTEREP